MILSSARAAAEMVATSAAAIAPTAKERIRNRIVMVLLRADFYWGQRTRQVRPELSPAHGFALSTSGRLGIRRFVRATPRKAAVAAGLIAAPARLAERARSVAAAPDRR